MGLGELLCQGVGSLTPQGVSIPEAWDWPYTHVSAFSLPPQKNLSTSCSVSLKLPGLEGSGDTGGLAQPRWNGG